jgi:RNA methyltransferase, TrmH family
MFLSSRSNHKIKFIRSLHQKKQRDQEALFLIEGESLVTEALLAGWPLLQVVSLKGLKLPELPAQTEHLEVESELMAYLTTLSSPPGLLAVAKQKSAPQRLTSSSCLLVTAALQDPGNFGALLRLADAMNLAGIWVLGSGVDPFHPKVVRGSMGSVLRVPVRILDSSLPLQNLQAEGWQLIATSAQGEASSFCFDFADKTAFLLGSEGPGLPAELIALADQHMRIPIQAQVESLNVVTAAAMLIHEYCRQYPRQEIF